MSKEVNKLRYAALEKALEISRGSSVIIKGDFTSKDVLQLADEVYAWLTKEETELEKQKLDWIKGQQQVK